MDATETASETSLDSAVAAPKPTGAIAALRAQREANRAAAAAQHETTPLEKGFSRLTFREIDRNHAALTALSQRRLTDGTNGPDKKIRTLLRRHYNEAHALFKDLHHLIITNNPVPKEWEDDQTIPIVIAERRQFLFEELMRDTFDIPAVPESLRLTSDDMPVSTIKGELGHQNRLAVVDIKIKLGHLYADSDNEEGDVD